MASASTYTPIATTTLGSSASSYTFNSIPTTYTDLELVLNLAPSSATNPIFQFGNGSADPLANYSQTFVSGTGSVANSNRTTSTNQLQAFINAAASGQSTIICKFQNYANTLVYKSILMRAGGAGNETTASVGLWRSSAAINTLLVSANMAAGTSLTLYGILAA